MERNPKSFVLGGKKQILGFSFASATDNIVFNKMADHPILSFQLMLKIMRMTKFHIDERKRCTVHLPRVSMWTEVSPIFSHIDVSGAMTS